MRDNLLKSARVVTKSSLVTVLTLIFRPIFFIQKFFNTFVNQDTWVAAFIQNTF